MNSETQRWISHHTETARNQWHNMMENAARILKRYLAPKAPKGCPTCADSECAIHPTTQWGKP